MGGGVRLSRSRSSLEPQLRLRDDPLKTEPESSLKMSLSKLSSVSAVSILPPSSSSCTMMMGGGGGALTGVGVVGGFVTEMLRLSAGFV